MRGFGACVLVVLLTCCVTCGAENWISTEDIMKFFDTYDTNKPPRLDGSTEVRIGAFMNSLTFDYQKGIMQMNMGQRMFWQDERFKKIFTDSDSDQKKLYFDDQMIKRAWRPDLFVRNAVKSGRVDSFMIEHLFHVNRTGHTTHVVKMIKDVYCPQLLSGHSTIMCSILVESYSYKMDTLYLAWSDPAWEADSKAWVPGHTLSDVILYDCSENYTDGNYACLEFRLVLTRDTMETTFDRGVYLVSAILVIISWLGFWIPPSNQRIYLGLSITLILTLLYMVVAEWREFSCSDCTKSAQVWLIFCIVMVLGMVLEYAVVYLVFGMLCTRLRGMCGGTNLPEDRDPKRSARGDCIDTAFGLVIFPAVFIITVFAVGFTTFAFR